MAHSPGQEGAKPAPGSRHKKKFEGVAASAGWRGVDSTGRQVRYGVRPGPRHQTAHFRSTPGDRTSTGRSTMPVSCQSSMVLDKSKRGCKTALVTKPGGNDEDQSSRPDAVGPCHWTAGCGPRLCRPG